MILPETYDLFRAISVASKPQVLIMGILITQGLINWETLEADSMSQGFVSIPTRNNNILYLVMTTEANMVENTQVIEHFCKSDHNIVVWDLVLTTQITDKIHKNMFLQSKLCWD